MNVCPQCGAELKAGDPAGLCPGCLLKAAVGSSFTSSEPGMRTETVQMTDVAERDSFGLFRVLRVLGEGGVGTVYLAEQTEPIHRRVALKVVKLGMDTKQVLARFNHERQSLNPMGRVYYSFSTLLCTPCSRSQEVGLRIQFFRNLLELEFQLYAGTSRHPDGCA